MSESIVKIKIKLGVNEAEIEAPLSVIKEAIHLLPEVVQHLPKSTPAHLQTKFELVPEANIKEGKTGDIAKILPEIKVEKNDSLPNVIIKFFQDSWGRQPHKLNDIKDALESYGLIYPKQSVAVALLRLAKDGKLRRFKDESGEYIYTSSISISINTHSTNSENVNFDKNEVVVGQ